MVKECIICGRPIKTGIKYCYVCRSQRNAQNQHHGKISKETGLIIFSMGIMAIALFSELWKYILIISILILIYEIYRIKVKTIKGIDKIDLVIISITITIVLIIILAKIIYKI